jgi:hypothetical protein
MRRNKRLNDCVMFAQWCGNHHVEPCDAAELISLADRAHSAGERDNTRSEMKLGRDFADLALRLGFNVEWNGLAPTLIRRSGPYEGRETHLPSIG